MTPSKKPIGIPGAMSLVRERRVTLDVMTLLKRNPPWQSPVEEANVRGTVDRCVSALIRSGETDETILKTEALRAVIDRLGSFGILAM